MYRKYEPQTHDFIFQLSDKQERIFRKWYKSHKCKHEDNDLQHGLGFDICFEVCMTKIGIFVKAKCVCGKEIDLSDNII